MVNACKDNPSQATCPFCLAKPKDINVPGKNFPPVSFEVFNEICLSILHFTINMFRHFCKVGAKLKANVKEYYARGEAKQARVKAADEEIKAKFDELGLQLKLKRFADGNMSRTAFQNLEFFSEAVGISTELLKRFNVIRIALASTLKKVGYKCVFSNLSILLASHRKSLILIFKFKYTAIPRS